MYSKNLFLAFYIQPHNTKWYSKMTFFLVKFSKRRWVTWVTSSCYFCLKWNGLWSSTRIEWNVLGTMWACKVGHVIDKQTVNALYYWTRLRMFTIIDLKSENYGERSIELILATDHAMQQSEVLLYPLVSFVSEFGGALGLFIGFSFMMILDAFEMLLQMFYNFMKTTKDQNF